MSDKAAGGAHPLTEGQHLARIVFCGIGWMGRYRGLAAQADKIFGGGRYVRENETGHEVCNFLRCDDGNVYGHVETIRGENGGAKVGHGSGGMSLLRAAK